MTSRKLYFYLKAKSDILKYTIDYLNTNNLLNITHKDTNSTPRVRLQTSSI